MINNNQRNARLAVSLAVGLLYVAFICARGMPALRHDWSWPDQTMAFRREVVDSASGWTSLGYGAPRAYPTDYLLDVVLFVLGCIANPAWVLGAVSMSIGALVAYGAMRMAAALGGSSVVLQVVCAFVAAFNVWCYNEIVAGHIMMVLAYGATMLLVAVIAGEEDVGLACSVALMAVFQQIQFFIVVSALSVYPLLRKRAFVAIATAAVLFAPIAYGVIFERGRLAATPYFLSWQITQSLQPFPAFMLAGYAPNYGAALGLDGAIAQGLFAIAAFFGAVTGWRRRATYGWLAACACIWCAVVGVNGPLSTLYIYAVEHVPASGVFRELYDLVGFLAIGYIALIAVGRTNRVLHVATFAAGAFGLFAWLASPPSHFWEASARLPRPTVHAVSGTRYALLPAFQPLSLAGGVNAGPDPDAWLRANDVTPLNEYLPVYPVSSALAKAERYHDLADLGALGVSTISCRPWLRSQEDALNASGAAMLPRQQCFDAFIARPVPMVAFAALPGIETGVPRLGSGNISILDAGVPGVRVATVPDEQSFDPTRAWINALLVERTSPYLASAYGGVYTRSLQPYVTKAPSWILAAGELRGASPQSAASYAWRRVNGTSVVCRSVCDIALVADAPPPERTAVDHQWTALRYAQVLPWLIRVDVPAGKAGELAYNATYDNAWRLVVGHWARASHRLDGVDNAWNLPPRSSAGSGWLVESVAAVQAALEFLATLWAGAMIVAALLRRRGREGEGAGCNQERRAPQVS